MKIQTQKAFTLALIATFYFNLILVIVKELAPNMKEFMKNYLLHHWLGHGILVLFFFMFCGLILTKINLKLNLEKMPFYIVSSIIITSLGISTFYIIHVH